MHLEEYYAENILLVGDLNGWIGKEQWIEDLLAYYTNYISKNMMGIRSSNDTVIHSKAHRLLKGLDSSGLVVLNWSTAGDNLRSRNNGLLSDKIYAPFQWSVKTLLIGLQS